jgi:predicted secreted protein
MSPVFSFFIIYIVSWWMMLFMVLPFGVKHADNPEGVAYAAAPDKPRLGRKFLITSVLALVPAGLLQWALMAGWLRGLI